MFEALPLALQELAGLFAHNDAISQTLLWMFPFFLFVELPMVLLVIAGVLRWYSKKLVRVPFNSQYTPKVSCIITCYSEGADVLKTLSTLCE